MLPLPCGLPARRPARDLEFYRPPDFSTNRFSPSNDDKYVAALIRPKPHQVLFVAQCKG
jgi:hypothetical protein